MGDWPGDQQDGRCLPSDLVARRDGNGPLVGEGLNLAAERSLLARLLGLWRGHCARRRARPLGAGRAQRVVVAGRHRATVAGRRFCCLAMGGAVI